MNKAHLSPVSNRESYSASFQAIGEDGTAIDLEAAGATIVCEMRERGCTSTTALTVLIEDDIFTTSLTVDQTRSLKVKEYEIGCTIEIDGVTTQFFIGTLPIIDGIVS